MLVLLTLLLSGTNAYADEKTLRFTPNLVTEGVPPPPRSLVDDIERYSHFRYADFQCWHPIRREMLIQTRFAEITQIHRLKSPAGSRSQLTFFGDTPQEAAFEPTSGDVFAFAKDKNGNEQFQKYTFDVKNGTSKLFSDGQSRNNGGIWSNKGDRYCYLSTRRNGEDDDAYIVDPTNPATDHMLAQNKGGEWETFDWSADDKTVLLNDNVSLEETHLWLVDTASGTKIPVMPTDAHEKIVYSSGKFSKAGKGIYTTTDRDSDFQRLAYIDLATKQHTYLTSNIPWDVEQFALSWDGQKIAAITNEDGLSTLHMFDTKSGKEQPAPSLPKGIIYGLTWHKNNQDLAFTFENARSQTDVYSVDISTGKVDRWTESETGGINPAELSDAKLFHWKTFDNRQLSGFMYRPPARFTGKRPVIIDIHGGPAAQARPEYLGRNNYLLNELGVAMIFPNVRGSTGYGKAFMRLDDGYKREDSYKDIATLLAWIKTQPDLDADRIMITGGSYGGHMTLACAVAYSDQIRCALDQVGTANFVTQLENTAPYGRDMRRAEYGDERDPAMRAFLEKIAPVNNADKITKPLYVVAGKNDPRVPASESKQIVHAVKEAGHPAWFLLANDEGHGFHKKRNQDFLFYTKVEFIKTFLLN